MEYWTMENILVKQLDFKNHGNLQNKYGEFGVTTFEITS